MLIIRIYQFTLEPRKKENFIIANLPAISVN